MIRIGKTNISVVSRTLYELVRPNLTKLAEKTHYGSITKGDLLHLVVFLNNKPDAFVHDEKRMIKYEILTPVLEEHDGEMQELAQLGLQLLAPKAPQLPAERQSDPAFAFDRSPQKPITLTTEEIPTRDSDEAMPHSRFVNAGKTKTNQ